MSQTIRNGQTIRVNIQTGEKLTAVAVTGTYSITVLAGTGTGTSLATNATGGTYGPYAYSLVVQIVASAESEIDYDAGVTTEIESDTVAKMAVDPLTGGVVGIIGASGTNALPFVGSLSTANSAAAATSNTAMLQAALTAGGLVQILADGTYYINATMTIPSNTTVVIGAGVTLKYLNNSGRCCFFVNANTQTSDSNIIITGGGILDCNYQNIGSTVSDVRLMGIRLTNVTNSIVENLTIINCLKYAVHITKCTSFTVRNLFIQTQSVGGDGVHVHGNSINGLIENIAGETGDDFIAINVKDVSNWLDPITPSISIGPIKNVAVRKITGNVYSANSGACVAVYSNTTGSATNITAASWTAGVVTVTCPSFTGVANQFVQIVGVTPVTYNGNFRMLTAAAGTFTFAMDLTPGAYTSGGTVDANYELSGITIDDIKPSMTNSGQVVNLASFPSPGQGGTIDDITVRNVRPVTNTTRVLQIGTCIGFLSASELRHNLASGATAEFIYSEPSLNHETLIFRDIANNRPYVGSLGALCKINSPVKNLKVENARLQVSGTATSGLILTNSGTNTALVFDSVEINNYSVVGLQSAAGLAGLELGSSAFPVVSISNMNVANMVNAIKGNGGTLGSNITINGLQVKNLTGGSAVITLYATGVVTNISVSGFIPRADVFGAFSFLKNAATGGAVTFVTASDVPNYTCSLNWFDATTPGAGSSLYANGQAIRADVTKLTRWDGCIINNTNAAAGTLGTAGLVSCQGTAANSWSLMATPTLKY